MIWPIWKAGSFEALLIKAVWRNVGLLLDAGRVK